MPSRIVDVIVDGEVILSEEVSWFRLPWMKPMTDEACIAEALDQLWYDRFEPPSNTTYRVRDP
jgi:hypothetical protein